MSVLNSKIGVQFEFLSFCQADWAGPACYKNSLTEQLISKRLASNCVNCSHRQSLAHMKHLSFSNKIGKSMRDGAARVLLSLSGECTMYIGSDPHTRNFSHVLISLSNS